MFRVNKFVLLFAIFLLAFTASSSILAKEPGYCVIQMYPGGGSVSKGCYSTQSESLRVATGGGIDLSVSSSVQNVTDTINQYNARKVSTQSFSTSGIVRPQTIYVIGLIYEDQNLSGTSTTITSTLSTGCVGTSYSGNLSAAWDNRVESAQGFLSCNYLIMYQDQNLGGSLNPCATPCNSYGLLNNQGSSIKLKPTYP